MSTFFQSKGERDPKAASAPRNEAIMPRVSSASESVSIIGPDMVITGNIASAGAVQIQGRVTGDIHVAQLTIGAGAHVEGKIIAQDAVIDGNFKGTIHGNSVKLRSTALVDGEIYNKSLTIEQNAQFEGVARRLDKAVDAPLNGVKAAAGTADVVQLNRAADRGYAPDVA